MGGITRTLFGGSKSSSSQSSSQQLDPQFKAAFLENVDRAKGVANNMGVRQFADFTPDQQNAFQMTRDLVARGMPELDAAQAMTVQAGMYQPQNVFAPRIRAANAGPAAMADAAGIDRGQVGNVYGGSFLNGNMAAYMSPYLDSVADSTMQGLDRARQIALTGNAADAIRAKAFGGSRQGVVEAETNKNFIDTAGKTIADLYNTGYNNAAALMGQDLSRGLTAQQSNQSADLNVANANAGFGQQANLANQSAYNQMAQYNTGNQQQANISNASNWLQGALANQSAGLTANNQRLSAAGQLGTQALSEQSALQTNINALSAIGSQQQQAQQAALDAVRNLPVEQLQLIMSALGVNVGGGSGMQSRSQGSSSSTSNNGIFKSIGLG